MTFVNRWSGGYFGWFDDTDLYTKDGRHVGRKNGKEIFAQDGNYVGELREHRLIVDIKKKDTRRRIGFIPARLKVLGPTVNPMDELELDLPDGFEDFPAPEDF